MTFKAKKPCLKNGCHNLTDGSYCPQHKKEIIAAYNAERESTTERGYGGTWPRVRMMKLNEYPLCERCASVQRITYAALVHHKDRNSFNNLESNLESLCVPCHDAEHKHDRFKR